MLIAPLYEVAGVHPEPRQYSVVEHPLPELSLHVNVTFCAEVYVPPTGEAVVVGAMVSITIVSVNAPDQLPAASLNLT